ncbi:MAG: NADH-dependent [FeFe] hydrogenase, group A6 [Clostridia bacterium]|nr:NADH-dependent [FeFe] hydrogenase, group A6 [Clostridia bacterium]
MIENITLQIDGESITVPEQSTVLEAAKKVGNNIPTLCHMEETGGIGACRICVVEIEGAKTLMPACITNVCEGMKVKTGTARVRNARRTILELMLSNHEGDCLTCSKSGKCELQKLCEEMGVDRDRYKGEKSKKVYDDSSPAIIRDSGKCILCRRCITQCSQVQGVHSITILKRGFDTVVAPEGLHSLMDVSCVQCGQCTLACPTGAITEKSYIDQVWANLEDADKHVVVQIAPAVRVALGEEFGMLPGSIVTGKTVSALKRMGFDRVFDTNFSADLTIMEEGHELIERMETDQPLPLITSCSPGWIKYLEHFYPQMTSHLSTCKSPQQMFGTIIKTYYAQKFNIPPKDIYTVSIMPCTAKKYECERPEMNSSGHKDVDAVLTTRELAKMIKEAGIDFSKLQDHSFDLPFSQGTGAGAIFGSSGGVMEAAVRTAYELLTGEKLNKLDFDQIRGMEGIKQSTINIGERQLKVAVINGLSNAKKILEAVSKGEQYHFVEIMCCPGGCLGGGGQPISNDKNIKEKRMRAIYQIDKTLPIRKSHENPAIKELYSNYLGRPLGVMSHKLLHTTYCQRSRF